LNVWWTKADSLNFNIKKKALAAQFNSYTVIDSIHLNGNLTLGENIADLGGIIIAFEAFKKLNNGKAIRSLMVSRRNRDSFCVMLSSGG
jgi:putative endopeptidase